MKALIISFFVLLSYKGFAQEKFIEVTVTDTAWVKPDNFLYRISVITEDDEGSVDTLIYSDPAAFKQKKKIKAQIRSKTMDSVKQIIKNNGYRILSLSVDDAFLVPGDMEYKNPSVLVITGTIDSLKSLFKIVSASQSLQGYVESVFATDESTYYRRLYKKLLAQAAENAATIAEFSGRKAGKIISVIESADAKNDNQNDWTIYPGLAAMASNMIPGWHTTIKGKSIYNLTKDELAASYIIHNSLKVRFGLD